MKKVFWDTNLFVYLFERTDGYFELVSRLRAGMRERGDRLFTSAYAVGEVLVLPEAAGDRKLRQRYEDFFAGPAVTVVPFDFQAASPFAKLRSSRKVRAGDAIQLACAVSAGADLFVTNDKRLAAQPVEGIGFITTIDRMPFGY